MVVGAACGGGDPAEPRASNGPEVEDPAASVAGPAQESEALVEVAGNDPVAAERQVDQADEADQVETMADLETSWAAARARTVAALAVPDYGVGADDRLRGPGGFEADLDRCPSGWEERAGVDDDTIRLAIVAPETGEYGSFADVATGMRHYFEYVNEQGGVDGRSVELVISDDAYEPARTARAVTELLAADEQPFYVTTVGSPTTLAVYETLNSACVPHPFVVSAHPAWGDPEANPFTTGFELSWASEALLWGTWIKENLPGMVPVDVAALVIDNDFGQIYADSFATWARSNRDIVSELVVVTHDPAATTVASEMAEIAEARPDVFLSMTSGQACLSAVTEAERSGLNATATALFTPSGCRQPTSYLQPAGSAGHGFWVVGGGAKSLNDPAFADETFVGFASTHLAELGVDGEQTLVGIGFAHYGWAHVELLRIAASLPGGLTRSNVILAMRSLDLTHPMLMDNVRFATDGIRDAFPVEGSEYSRYDANSASWFVQGSAVDVDGATPNCTFAGLACQQ